MRDHGGSLAKAEALFPFAPKPWIDCSTGINPHPYPLGLFPASAWQRLPEPEMIEALCEAAARAYGAPNAANVVAAPGTQILLPRVAALVKPGRARVLGPTYAEHARTATLAGHRVEEVQSLDALGDADLAVVVNPNNPDGRLISADALLALAARLAGHHRLLVVDEAFMDAMEVRRESVAGAVEAVPNLVVLRSFGKFFGLAGLRLGFALASNEIAGRLRDELGPWAVSGPAAVIGAQALRDRGWQDTMRLRLARAAEALDRVLASHGLRPAGGTSLYRFLRHPRAADIFTACGEHGIYLRRFDRMPDALRIGLPESEEGLARLDHALKQWSAGE